MENCLKSRLLSIVRYQWLAIWRPVVAIKQRLQQFIKFLAQLQSQEHAKSTNYEHS